MNGDERPEKDRNDPEMLELQADASSVKWFWLAIIILILCITGYKMLKLYYEYHG